MILSFLVSLGAAILLAFFGSFPGLEDGLMIIFIAFSFLLFLEAPNEVRAASETGRDLGVLESGVGLCLVPTDNCRVDLLEEQEALDALERDKELGEVADEHRNDAQRQLND